MSLSPSSDPLSRQSDETNDREPMTRPVPARKFVLTIPVPLSNPRQVQTLLDRAKSRRAVAATLMNERSSRSHSVFTLKVKGVNPLTGEQCEAMLNLGRPYPLA